MRYGYILMLLGVSLLGVIITDGYIHQHHRAEKQKAISDLIALENAIDKLYFEQKIIPDNYDDLKKYLLAGYIKRMTEDAWGEPYVYSVAKSERKPYRIYSKGENRKDDLLSGDDVVVGKSEYPKYALDKYRKLINYISDVSMFVGLASLILLVIFSLRDICLFICFLVRKWLKKA